MTRMLVDDSAAALLQALSAPAPSENRPLPIGACVAVWIVASLGLWTLIFSPVLW